jgi:hypothetical protein
MGAQERRVQPETQATPLAQDILALLQGQLRGVGPGVGPGAAPTQAQGRGALLYATPRGGPRFEAAPAGGFAGGFAGTPGPEFGLGLTPLQREAGTAARQFVSSGGGAFDVSPLLAQLEEIQRRRVGETVADIREGFGIAGSRFGTPVAVGQAQAASQLETQFGAQIGELLRQEFANQQQRMLQGIALLQNIGTANIEPFLRFAGMGILPEQITYEQSPFVTALGALGGAATGAGELIGAV